MKIMKKKTRLTLKCVSLYNNCEMYKRVTKGKQRKGTRGYPRVPKGFTLQEMKVKGRVLVWLPRVLKGRASFGSSYQGYWRVGYPRVKSRVSIQGVKSLWVDRRFIPADQGSYWVICAICSFWILFTKIMIKSVKVFPFSFWKKFFFFFFTS